MKVERVKPPPPPDEFRMTFSRADGWVIVMALRDAYKRYEAAADRSEWLTWVDALDKELRA